MRTGTRRKAVWVLQAITGTAEPAGDSGDGNAEPSGDTGAGDSSAETHKVVVHRAWNGSRRVTVKKVTVTGVTLYLGAGMIPEAGAKPDAGYQAGKWDTEPVAGMAINSDVTFTYSYVAVPATEPGSPAGPGPEPVPKAKKSSGSGSSYDGDSESEDDSKSGSDKDKRKKKKKDKNRKSEKVSYTVIFRVVYGAWNAGTTEEKKVVLSGTTDETLHLSAEDIPAVGARPNAGFRPGTWDIVPDVNTPITSDMIYTYTYAKLGVKKSPKTGDPFPVIPVCVGCAFIALGMILLKKKR